MAATLAFDIYGTLIDTHGVLAAMQALMGDKAEAFSQTWRDKQLEYSFRRGFMQNYQPFSVCTAQALEYTCARQQVSLSRTQKDDLLKLYTKLPAFDEAAEALRHLNQAGFRLFAFSNGSTDAVNNLLIANELQDYFVDVVSTDEIKSFKPNPAVYCHFLRRAEVLGQNAWMISSNSFDVIGALSAGMRAIWVRRSSQQLLDPWEFAPTLTVSNLLEIATHLK